MPSGGGLSARERLRALLREAVERGASDLHLTVGARPKLRIDGRLADCAGEAELRAADTEALAGSILSDRDRKRFARDLNLDVGFGVDARSRFRANLYRQRGSVGCAIRLIPQRVPKLAELGLPPVVARLAERRRGLVLVTGPTGSGKSTTLAAMVDRINSERAGHVVTIEDPIEYVHAHGRGIVNQREVGRDAPSFADALKWALRQDPDAILIGEMRDGETIQAALTVAETGHLALATLHTYTAAEAVNRIVDAFPAHRREQVSAQLALVLEGVVAQVLLPKADGRGRVAACEALLATPAIRAMIREGRLHQIPSAMQAAGRLGMRTMNESLYRLHIRRRAGFEACLEASPDQADFRRRTGTSLPGGAS